MIVTDFPSELEFLEFFGAEPVREDTLLSYSVRDAGGTTFCFSFDFAEGSIQTDVTSPSGARVVTSREGLARIWIDSDVLQASFEEVGCRTQLRVELHPVLLIRWSTLRTQ